MALPEDPYAQSIIAYPGEEPGPSWGQVLGGAFDFLGGPVGLANLGLQTFLSYRAASERNKAVQRMFEAQVRRNWLKKVQVRYNEIAVTEQIGQDMRRAHGKLNVAAPAAGSLSFQETRNSTVHAAGVRETVRAQFTADMQQKAIDYETENARMLAEGQMVNKALAVMDAIQRSVGQGIGIGQLMQNLKHAKETGPILEQIASNREIMQALENIARSLGIDILDIERQRAQEAQGELRRDIETTGPLFGIGYAGAQR